MFFQRAHNEEMFSALFSLSTAHFEKKKEGKFFYVERLCSLSRYNKIQL